MTELIDDIVSGSGVAGREHDFDVRTELACSRHRVLRFVEGPPDHGGGGLVLALGEPEQREAWLRIVAVLAGANVGGLRGIEVEDETKKVTLDRARAAERAGVDGCGEPIAHVPRLDESFGPRTEQLEDLGAVQEAVTPVEDELLLRVTPPDERVGPGSAAFEVEQLRAGVDHRCSTRRRQRGVTARRLRSRPWPRPAGPALRRCRRDR